MTNCAIVGDPVAHSLSPVLHRRAYEVVGLDWSYQAHRVAAGTLASFVAGLDASWRGLSVTAPLKHEAARLAATIHGHAKTIGVANTLVRDDAGWQGYNTDVSGAVAALHSRGVDRIDTVAMLGAGATAVSVLAAAKQLGARRLDVWVRDAARAEPLVAHGESWGIEAIVHVFGQPPTASVDLLVNTIPSDALGCEAEAFIASTGALFDVIYDPWPTTLMTLAGDQRRGGRPGSDSMPVVTGRDLLVYQAVDQIRLMTGRAVDPEVLLQALT